MRNLKRALSLALASIMVLGMMVVGAGAVSVSDFSDSEKIANKEAVSVLTTLNVINGKDDGSYDPEGTVTRAEMAKMICVILNGGKDPSLGNATTNTFTDTVGHWASPYIEYCTKLGIVSGRGDGTFDPNGNVTGSEAAKMLLAATGYQASIEGFTGANWEIGTNVRANQVGLYDGLSIAPSTELNRDSAAQMVYNMLDVKVVTYKYTLTTDGSSVSSVPEVQYQNASGDKDITVLEDKFNAVKVEGVVIANEVANLESSSDKGSALDDGKTKIVIDKETDQTYYTGTKTFAVSSTIDELGRYVALYVKKESNSVNAQVLGSVIVSEDNKVVVDSSADAIADVADDNDLDVVDATQIAKNYKNLATLTTAVSTNDGINGQEKILIDNDNDGDLDFVLLNTYYFGKVTSYSASGDGSIAIDVGATDAKVGKTVTKLSADKSKNVVGFEDVAKDDYVLAQYIGGKLYVEQAESVTGTLEAYKDGSFTDNGTKVNLATKITVDGTDYNVSHVYGYVGGDDDVRQAGTAAADSVKNEATFFLDKNGRVAAIGEAEANAGKYAMVLAVGTAIEDRVKVALADGTVATYDINTNGVKKAALKVGQVYSYSINSKDEIKLTNVNIKAADMANASFEKGKISIKATSMTTQYANKNTAFFYVTSNKTSLIDSVSSISSDDVDTYASYEKAPDLGDDVYATVYTKGTGSAEKVVAVVFFGSDLVTADVGDNLYIASVTSTDGDDTKVKAFVNGSSELKEIVVSGTVANGDLANRGTYTYSLNSDGTYDLKHDYTLSGSTVTNVTGRNFVVDGVAYRITSDTVIVDDSKYLDSVTATLGTSGNVSKDDKIIGLVANSDNDALMVVIRNEKNGGSSTVTTYNTTVKVDANGVVTVTYYGATAPSNAEIATLLADVSGVSNVTVNGSGVSYTYGGRSYGPFNLSANNTARVYKVTYNGTEKGYLATTDKLEIADQSKSTLLSASAPNSTTGVITYTVVAGGNKTTVDGKDYYTGAAADIDLVDGYSFTNSTGLTVTPVKAASASGKYPAGTVLTIENVPTGNSIVVKKGTDTVATLSNKTAFTADLTYEMPANDGIELTKVTTPVAATLTVTDPAGPANGKAAWEQTSGSKTGVYTAKDGSKFNVTFSALSGMTGDVIDVAVTPVNSFSGTVTVDGKDLTWTNQKMEQIAEVTLAAGTNNLTIADSTTAPHILTVPAGITVDNGDLKEANNYWVAKDATVTLNGLESTSYFKAGTSYVKDGANTFTMPDSDLTITGDKYHKVDVTSAVGGSATNAANVTLTASTTTTYVKQGDSIEVTFALAGSGDTSGAVNLVLDTVTGLTSTKYNTASQILANTEGNDAGTDMSGKSDTVTFGTGVATADVTVAYTMSNG